LPTFLSAARHFNHQRLEVIARDGTVTKEIHPATPYFDPNDPNPLDWVSMIGGVDFQPGGTLLCGVDNNLVEYTFEGNLVRMVSLDTGWFEGITRLPTAPLWEWAISVGCLPSSMPACSAPPAWTAVTSLLLN
jgi:hypothetical protein